MSDFWSNRLAPVRPVPRQEPVSSHRPWWDDSPSPAPAQQAVQQPQQHYQAPHYQAPPQAKSAESESTCPKCRMDSYHAPLAEGPSTMVGPSRRRCFSCGYPVTQTGSDGIRTHSGSGATPTRQIHDGSSQVNSTPFAHI